MRYRLNAMSIARLGLVVSKKKAKLAVQRNYMRRVLRELFRLNQQYLPSIDLVIQIQKAFDKSEFDAVKLEFEMLTKKLAEKSILVSNIGLKNDAGVTHLEQQ